MPIETIGDRIIADASAEAERLKAKATETAGKIVEESKAEARRLIEDAVDRAERAGAQKKMQQLAAAGLAARDRLIGTKQELIDQAFNRAGELIDGASEDRYIDMLTRLIAAGAAGGEEVVFDGANTAVAKTAVEKANEALKVTGRPPVSLASGTRPIGKGFILSAGKIEESFSVKTLLEMAREDLEAEVAQMLFGDED